MSIHFGVDYEPELWKKERWEIDAQLMQRMGVQAVRMGEFSWGWIEPALGEFHFEALDEVVDLMNRYGIKTILATPSAAPPAWIIEKNPEIQPIDRDGHRHRFGGRYHYCLSNKTYRAHINRLLEAYTKHFSDNKGVIGWQVDSCLDSASRSSLCMCGSCRAYFQKWLEYKYKTIERLNAAWGTAFWSQGYTSFSQIGTPLLTVEGENPSQLLDWRCFYSDLTVDFATSQADIIRKNCPNHFITHNLSGTSNLVNCHDLYENLDFVSSEVIPLRPSPDVKGEKHVKKSYEVAAFHDVVRGYKHSPFWVMAQQAGMAGMEYVGRALESGELTSFCMQSVAHGAQCVMFYPWRATAFGAQQYWQGILGHSGKIGRTYDEACAVTSKFSKYMEEWQGAMPKTQVAIVYNFRQSCAFDIQPTSPELSYLGQLMKYYKPLYDKKIPVDFVKDTEDLSGYNLVIAPLQCIMNEGLAQRYTDYVAHGGHLVLTMRTGVKDENNICIEDCELPAGVKDICGIKVDESDCLLKSGGVLYGKTEYNIEKWADIITLKGASCIAEYTTGFYKQTPAITENMYGNGITWYVGTEAGDELMEDLIKYFTEKSDISPLGIASDEVEMMTREGGGRRWLFVINHSGEEQVYSLNDAYTMLEGERSELLLPYEVQIFVKDI